MGQPFGMAIDAAGNLFIADYSEHRVRKVDPNGVITAVGPAASLAAATGAKITDLPGCVIIPGLVNAHTHLELTHFPAWKVRKDLDYLPKTYVEWIRQVMKIRRALTPQEVEHSFREGLRRGIYSAASDEVIRAGPAERRDNPRSSSAKLRWAVRV